VGKEIERKFLVTGDQWRGLATGTRYRQGYLSSARERTVRVRIAGDRAYLTIKGAVVGATRLEFEYEIPPHEADALLALCESPLIEKTRYRIAYEGLVWEVDEFHGENEGLVVAECELVSEDQPILPPTWIGTEVTEDPRYYNANLVARPYRSW
jgi:CYTH domain-containing protein